MQITPIAKTSHVKPIDPGPQLPGTFLGIFPGKGRDQFSKSY